MAYDFSSVTERKNTGSFKWLEVEDGTDFCGSYPLSVADMEWRTPEAVRKACAQFAMNGFYCYTDADKAYRDTVRLFMKRRHDWDIKNDWIVCTYGIVSAIHTAVKAYTEKNDGIIVQTPVYAHFYDAVLENERTLVKNPLILNNNRYEINFAQLEEQCKNPLNKMLILCSPHNPTGRVWTKDELTKIADLCHDNGVILISDEIHFDIVRTPHTVITSINDKYYDNTVVCTAMSKSFNIAGLGTSNIIIGNDGLREKFIAQINKDGYSCINCFAYPATLSAYTECDGWLDEMNAQVNRNFEILGSFLKKYIPGAKLTEREGTYLAWIDVSFLGLGDGEILKYISDNAGFLVSGGTWFGEEGKGFIRMNIAVPEKVLTEVLERFREMCDKL